MGKEIVEKGTGEFGVYRMEGDKPVERMEMYGKFVELPRAEEAARFRAFKNPDHDYAVIDGTGRRRYVVTLKQWVKTLHDYEVLSVNRRDDSQAVLQHGRRETLLHSLELANEIVELYPHRWVRVYDQRGCAMEVTSHGVQVLRSPSDLLKGWQ